MNRKRILILAEGFEEKTYIEKIIKFPCISKNYEFSNVINVKGNGNILARYQYEFQTNRYDLVLVFADADKGSTQFISIIEGIGEKIFGDKKKGVLIFMFVNPVTMQVILSHLGDVELNHVSKNKNSETIRKLTGIDNYDAKEKQINELMQKINSRNYQEMKRRIEKMSSDYRVVPSTNLLMFLKNFENDDTSWVDEINNQIAFI